MRRRRFMDEFGPVIFYTAIALMVVALFFVCFAFSRKESAPVGGTANASSAPDGESAAPAGAFTDLLGNSGGETQTGASGEGGQAGDLSGTPGEGGQTGDPAGTPGEGSQPGEPSGTPDGSDPGAGSGEPAASAPTVTSPDGTVFTAVNETVYAQENVNMRTAPSTNGSILAILKRGQSATRTGVSEYGWSQIVYEGNTVYVSSDYIGTAAP